MEMVTLCVLCICGVLFGMYLGEQNKLFGQVIVLILTVFIILVILNKLSDLLAIVEIIQEIAGINGTYVELLLKMTGIVFVAEFTSDICEEQGCKAIGKQVMLCGRLAVLMVGYPLLLEFIEIMRKFLT